jgi:hypothetical protein
MWDLLFDWPALLERGYDAAVYLIMAVVATLLFLIRLGMSMSGGGGSDFEADTSFDSDASFTILSVLSILAFFMGAGWMGLAARLDWELGRLASSLLAAGFGFAMMMAAAGMSHAARRLDRTVEYDLRTAVGRSARVYLTVPPVGQGSGQVEVSVSGRRKVVRAVSAGPRLEAFSQVTIVGARDDETLVAAPEPVPGSPAS